MFGKADRYVCLACCWTIERVSAGVDTCLPTLLWVYYCWTQRSFTGAGAGTYLPTFVLWDKATGSPHPGKRLAIIITEHVKKCTPETFNEVMPIKYKCAHIIPLYQQGGEVLKQK